MKPPDHPIPSGDRAMAQALLQALRHGGHDVSLPTPLRSYFREPAPEQLQALRAAADGEIDRLVSLWRQGAGPELWFTYHLYYKSPDLVGPGVARALGIPYVAAEASWTRKRSLDAWSPWQAEAERGLAQCRTIFSYTERDLDGLRGAPGISAHMVSLPPFIDAAAFPPPPKKAAGEPVRLMAGAMMRPGNKTESYCFLAEALRHAPAKDWRLEIVGDGPMRGEIERAFADFAPGQVRFSGLLDARQTAAAMMAADIFVWPGIREAYGMVYLEAQACGTPVVALDSGGVAATLLPDLTGKLVRESTAAAYGSAITQLMMDRELRLEMGRRARDFVARERTIESAAEILSLGMDLSFQ